MRRLTITVVVSLLMTVEFVLAGVAQKAPLTAETLWQIKRLACRSQAGTSKKTRP
ncbi:MAG: hypothetical protein MUF51_08630 [Vicinamibacteria bacterium]|nr:hypothetical protein [Vicinamibacteria bacterium]